MLAELKNWVPNGWAGWAGIALLAALIAFRGVLGTLVFLLGLAAAAYLYFFVDSGVIMGTGTTDTATTT